MNLHRLAEERSIELHRAIGQRLMRDPSIVLLARARIAERKAAASLHADLLAAWERVLSLPLPELVAFLSSSSAEARELRQTTPFAGVVPPRERWSIWRSVKARASITR
ncbi:MAG TPA: hypothetical protein VJT73_21865 [Polyangiaceae bacterium]|nr:hypothetical protein [Polyangiaceae bacterium]